MTPREYIEARLAVLRELDRAEVTRIDERRRGKIVAYEDALAAMSALEPAPAKRVIVDHRAHRVWVRAPRTPGEHLLGRVKLVRYEDDELHFELESISGRWVFGDGITLQ